MTREEFINECTKIHNGKYDYSKVEYNGIFGKVKIICPIHGEFEQIAHLHKQGHGCKKCQYEKVSTLRKDDKESFIEKAKKIHRR